MVGSRGKILVVVSRGELRRLIGRVVEELDLQPVLCSAWDAACANAAPDADAVIVDLDDLDGAIADQEFAARIGGAPAPLIAISRRINVGTIAPRLGAVAGLRKPLDVGQMLETLGGVVHR